MSRYAHGELSAAITAALAGGPLPCSEIAAAVGRDWCSVNDALRRRLLPAGRVEKSGPHKHVVWSLA